MASCFRSSVAHWEKKVAGMPQSLSDKTLRSSSHGVSLAHHHRFVAYSNLLDSMNISKFIAVVISQQERLTYDVSCSLYLCDFS